jgi:YqaJ-like viral recombinase domain
VADVPDPDRRTISATQSPALYNASPYLTPWLLYHYLRGGALEQAETDRMAWGKRLQPLVLEQVQRDLKLTIVANEPDTYVHSTHAPLGYTADATTMCPDRGAGAVEVKCVFDYSVWMRAWDAGRAPPRHVELQLQHQLTVGDGDQPFPWGVIAAWVCGEMKYFERKRDDTVSVDLIARCFAMMRDVEAQHEPDPFGAAIELPMLAQLFPIVKGQELDLRGDPSGPRYAQLAADLKNFKEQENFFSKAAGAAREQLLFLARDSERVLLPGATLKLRTQLTKEHVRRASTHTSLSVELTGEEAKPQELPDGSPV